MENIKNVLNAEQQKGDIAVTDYAKDVMEENGLESAEQNLNVIDQQSGESWTLYNGDSALVLKGLPSNSIDISCYSPPFKDLFTYSASEHDLGNCRTSDEFDIQYCFIIRELLRVTKPGRISCVHTSDIPALLSKDQYIGLKDFPGEVIRAHEKEGWIYHGWALVGRNPQSQAIRVRAKGLSFGQLSKDSSWNRPCLLDRVIFFRKPGENKIPVTPAKNGEMDNETWIDWASGIWLGINETKTLQYTTSRDPSDERHVCPLQLDTIERCIKLYSNPGETVLTPFLGIGSEAWSAIKYGRKTIGIELKSSYFKKSVENLREIESTVKSDNLFAMAGITV